MAGVPIEGSPQASRDLAPDHTASYGNRGTAQVPKVPTDYTEGTSVGNLFIGQDCGEYAFILISGRIIRNPRSRANRANRGVWLRERREGGSTPVSEPADPFDATEPAVSEECHLDYVEYLPLVDDIDCGDPHIPGDAVRLYDPVNDAYELDSSNGEGNGVGCNGD